METNSVEESSVDNPTMDKPAAEATEEPENEPKEIETMDITEVGDYSGESHSSDYSSSSQESCDDDNMSQSSDCRVINEVSGRQVPVSSFQEGKARIQVPISYKVFFNPVQEFNRDLSIAVLTLFAEDHFREDRSQKKKKKRMDSTSQNTDDLYTLHLSPGIRYKDGIEILEALSASGLRSIRYALEVPGVKQITANDMSRSAVLNIEDNVEINNVEDIVITSQSDAVWLMQQQKADSLYFDAIDLDPYGCPSKFLDSAVNAVRDGGLLLVTCTDMAVLAGNTPESCYSKYGAISLRNSACHEMALRIALQCIESHCNRYGRYIVPMLSVSADFYIRLFVKLYTSPQKCKQSMSKLSNVYQCSGCCALTLQPLGAVKDNGNNQFKYSLPTVPAVGETCVHCSHRFHMGGPVWNGPIHDKPFVKRMIELVKKSADSFQTGKRMLGMLTVIDEELPDVPLYYTLSSLCNRIHCEMVPLKEFRSALLNGGFQVSMAHCASNSIKTNAPTSVLWDILRCWVKTHPVAEKRMVDPVCANLLKKEPEFIANFDIHPDALPESIKNGLLRYQPNPAPNWGPGSRSKQNILGKGEGSKRQNNQNKRKRAHQPTDPSDSVNGDDIPIVTLSDDDDSMDLSNLSAETDAQQNKKQRLEDLDTSVEVTDGRQVISLDDDEVTEIDVLGSESVGGSSEKAKSETVESSVESAEKTVENGESSETVADELSKPSTQEEVDATESNSAPNQADVKPVEDVNSSENNIVEDNSKIDETEKAKDVASEEKSDVSADKTEVEVAVENGVAEKDLAESTPTEALSENATTEKIVSENAASEESTAEEVSSVKEKVDSSETCGDTGQGIEKGTNGSEPTESPELPNDAGEKSETAKPVDSS